MLNTFWTYSLWAFQFLAAENLRWISSAFLVVLAVDGLVTFRSPTAWTDFKSSYRKLLILLAGFPLSIAVGVIFRAPSPTAPSLAGKWLLNGIDVLALVFAIYCIYRAKGVRWFTAGIVVAELWLILLAGLVAGMSVTGDWL